MKNHKKIIAIIFLLTGCTPVLFTLFFLIKQQVIRHEMKERLEEEAVCTIRVSEKDIVWVKYKKEIIVDGKMFDIKSFTKVNDVFIFTGLYDDDETELVKNFENDFNRKNNHSNQLLSELFKMIQSQFCDNPDQATIYPRQNTTYINLTLSNTLSPFINILTPPPQG